MPGPDVEPGLGQRVLDLVARADAFPTSSTATVVFASDGGVME